MASLFECVSCLMMGGFWIVDHLFLLFAKTIKETQDSRNEVIPDPFETSCDAYCWGKIQRT